MTLTEDPSPPSDSPDQDAVLRLENATFSEKTAAYDIAANGFRQSKVLMCGDSLESVSYFTDGRSEGWTASVDKAPKDRPGIDASNDWFVDAQEV